MDLREINFGVEIETVKRTRERVARAIHSVVGGIEFRIVDFGLTNQESHNISGGIGRFNPQSTIRNR